MSHIYSACDVSYLSESCYVVGFKCPFLEKRTSGLQSRIAEVCEDYVGTWFETDMSATLCDWHACSNVGALLCMMESACSL